MRVVILSFGCDADLILHSSQHPRSKCIGCHENYTVSKRYPPLTTVLTFSPLIGLLPRLFSRTEFDNLAALSLYESLGFIREKRLHRFLSQTGKTHFASFLKCLHPNNDENQSSKSNSSRLSPHSRPPTISRHSGIPILRRWRPRILTLIPSQN